MLRLPARETRPPGASASSRASASVAGATPPAAEQVPGPRTMPQTIVAHPRAVSRTRASAARHVPSRIGCDNLPDDMSAPIREDVIMVKATAPKPSLLGSTDLFRGIPHKELERLQRLAAPRQYAAGQT